MVDSAPKVLQIVPKIPGGHDGVGDYALSLARILSTDFGMTTSFAVASELESSSKDHEYVILHYVNYGYQKRGVPFGLLSSLRNLRRNSHGRFVTIFHELYASGPMWRSAFWLQPFQRYIARSIARISDVSLFSSETMLNQLRALWPNVCAEVQPVFSNFGEPLLLSDQFSNRDPHRWVICGGTALIERSLRSFRAILNRIPEFFSPRELYVLGGSDSPAARSLFADLANVRVDYHPQIDAGEASQILSTCSFGWLDYFHRSNVPSDIILKSSAFGAMCAHGVITVFPHRGSPIAIDGDAMPGPYFMDAQFVELSPANDREKVASQIYHWYQRNASSEHRARTIGRALGIMAAEDRVP
jgi:hypothetical protein